MRDLTMTISDIAELCSVSTKSIRNWTKKVSAPEFDSIHAKLLQAVGHHPATFTETEIIAILRVGGRIKLIEVLYTLRSLALTIKAVTEVSPDRLPIDAAQLSISPQQVADKILIPIAAMATAFNMSIPEFRARSLDFQAIIVEISGQPVEYYPVDTVPAVLRQRFLASYTSDQIDLDDMRKTLSDENGEVWITGPQVERYLVWTTMMVARRGHGSVPSSGVKASSGD